MSFSWNLVFNNDDYIVPPKYFRQYLQTVLRSEMLDWPHDANTPESLRKIDVEAGVKHLWEASKAVDEAILLLEKALPEDQTDFTGSGEDRVSLKPLASVQRIFGLR